MQGIIQEIFRFVLPLRKNLIDNRELLYLATERNQVDIVELLLRFRASVNHSIGGTAVAYAAFNYNRKLLRLLLNTGSSVLALPTQDFTVTLLYRIINGDAPTKDSFRTLSILHEHFRDYFIPVIDNFDKYGFTTLYSATIYAKLQNIALLLESFGADPTIPIRGTSIGLTTLVILARTYLSAYVRIYSDESINQYDADIAAVLDYLIKIQMLPAPRDNIREYQVTTLQEHRTSIYKSEVENDQAYNILSNDKFSEKD